MKAKRIFAFVAAAIVLFGVGCTKENTSSATTSECMISLSTNQLVVGCAGGDELSVAVTSNGEWSVTTNNDAVTVSPKSGNGDGYIYNHDCPNFISGQDYLETPVKLYNPSNYGAEKQIAERLEEYRKIKRRIKNGK